MGASNPRIFLGFTEVTICDFLEIPQLQSDGIEKGIYTLFCFYSIDSVFINFEFYFIFLKLIF
jgi:hypothetical protein